MSGSGSPRVLISPVGLVDPPCSRWDSPSVSESRPAFTTTHYLTLVSHLPVRLTWSHGIWLTPFDRTSDDLRRYRSIPSCRLCRPYRLVRCQVARRVPNVEQGSLGYEG